MLGIVYFVVQLWWFISRVVFALSNPRPLARLKILHFSLRLLAATTLDLGNRPLPKSDSSGTQVIAPKIRINHFELPQHV